MSMHISQKYHRDGYIIQPDFFSTSMLEEAKDIVQKMENEAEIKEGIWKYFENDDNQDSALIRIENFLDRLPEDFIKNCNKLVETCVGEPVDIFKEKINFKKSGTGYFAPHQDAQAGWQQYGHSIHHSLGIALDDCTLENGCLFIAPGRHKEGLLGENFGPMREDILNEIEWKPLECQAGDVFLFDSFLPHQSQINKTASDRCVLFLTYNLAREGDGREAYHSDKLNNHPPRIYKEKGKQYRGYVI